MKSYHQAKHNVTRVYPDAFCVQMNDKSGFIVWPGKVQPRGFERPAIGYGKTAYLAWRSVKL